MKFERHQREDGEHVLVHCERCRTTKWLTPLPNNGVYALAGIELLMIKSGWEAHSHRSFNAQKTQYYCPSCSNQMVEEPEPDKDWTPPIDDGGPAFPIGAGMDPDGYGVGMTQRAYIATHQMAGLQSNRDANSWDAKRIAKAALESADALIAALKEPADAKD